jgi:hypothetical protein
MRRLPIVFLAVSFGLSVFICGCGESEKESPLTGKDFVSVIVANHYMVEPTACEPEGDGFRWTFKATNRSDYSWKGTLTFKLVNAESRILDRHDFDINEMVSPGEITEGLEFVSEHAIHDIGGEVTKVLVQADVTDYVAPEDEG